MPYQKRWSVTRLKALEHCARWYKFLYLDEDKDTLPKKPEYAFGNLCHTLMEMAWTGKDESFLYKSANSMFNAAKRLWYMSYVFPETDTRGGKIQWSSNGQPHILAKRLRRYTRSMYYRYRQEPSPTFQELKLETKVMLEIGKRTFEYELEGVIDAIHSFNEQDGITVSDYKTDRYKPSISRLGWDRQPTAYAFLISTALRNDSEFRQRLNYPQSLIDSTPKDSFLLPMINPQFDHLRSGNSFRVSRTNKDVIRLLTTIPDKMILLLNEIYPRSEGDHCLRCLRRLECDSEKERGVHLRQEDNPQTEIFPIERQKIKLKVELFPIKYPKTKSRKRPQKSFRFPKEN